MPRFALHSTGHEEKYIDYAVNGFQYTVVCICILLPSNQILISKCLAMREGGDAMNPDGNRLQNSCSLRYWGCMIECPQCLGPQLLFVCTTNSVITKLRALLILSISYLCNTLSYVRMCVHICATPNLL